VSSNVKLYSQQFHIAHRFLLVASFFVRLNRNVRWGLGTHFHCQVRPGPALCIPDWIFTCGSWRWSGKEVGLWPGAASQLSLPRNPCSHCVMMDVWKRRLCTVYVLWSQRLAKLCSPKYSICPRPYIFPKDWLLYCFPVFYFLLPIIYKQNTKQSLSSYFLGFIELNLKKHDSLEKNTATHMEIFCMEKTIRTREI
jgi:hypothetical protein